MITASSTPSGPSAMLDRPGEVSFDLRAGTVSFDRRAASFDRRAGDGVVSVDRRALSFGL
jgi:hypothetical protein